ncbi:MAG: 1-deoxy-D-xylulose-5-phosphate synthase [Elusimicrobiales bacterium]
MRYLPYIKNPADLKRLRVEELDEVAKEIREHIINVVSHNGGHLASSLGAVDIIVALHYVYDSPRDKIIFDTGHQAYAHKILTGRFEKFETLRRLGGISGFLKRSESEHDIFGAGHASTALSAACGIAAARDILKEDYKVVCVVGDGTLTGGMSWEAMQNIGQLNQDMLVVLNDNQMFISHRVGQLGKILTKILTKGLIKNAGEKIKLLLNRFQFGGKNIIKVAKRARVIFFPGMIFEEMGFAYFGPVDGHNIKELVEVLGYLKDLKGPVLLHTITKKGKGYEHAEKKPISFHGVSKFDKQSGEVIKIETEEKKITFTEIFSDTLIKLAEKNPKIVAITAAMPEGTGLDKFRDIFPYRYFDVGIAEEHAVTFAAGLATQGFHPVVAIYSTFMQRAFDQVMHDIALQKLPIVICMDRSGIVGEDGPTHHGVFDLGLFRMLPEIIIMAPSDENELKNCLYSAFELKKPVIIRYPRGSGFGVKISENYEFLPPPNAVKLMEGSDMIILATGSRVNAVIKASNMAREKGINPSVYYFRYVKPIDREVIKKLDGSKVITVEDNALMCGFSSAVIEEMAEMGVKADIIRIGIPDRFIEHGSSSELYKILGMDEEGIFKKIVEISAKAI